MIYVICVKRALPSSFPVLLSANMQFMQFCMILSIFGVLF